LCCLLAIQMSLAQDSHLAQYEAAYLYLNPAMTGMFNGKYRAHIHTRRQWAAIMKKPFRTSMASFDMPMPIEKKLKNLSVGAFVKNSRAGSGNFNTFNFLISGAYNLTGTSNKNHHISTGIQVGIIQKSSMG